MKSLYIFVPFNRQLKPSQYIPKNSQHTHLLLPYQTLVTTVTVTVTVLNQGLLFVGDSIPSLFQASEYI